MSIWDSAFGPCYTPKEMLELGVFEGKYINVLKGLPSDWYKLDKVLGKEDEPDPSINYFKIKSRQPLSVWKSNGWLTKESPWGWFGWYCHYYLGKRIEGEDKWQIDRWKSFVARHQGQINANCSLKDKECRPKQRQALLQWGWDSSVEYTPVRVGKNVKAIAKSAGAKLE